ncbi:uncharacterized protein LOC125178041 [Hyalella azteca]|uniref:Uncharacterized protein LOC125178041 n=1 Tax=Hyalella azteca TaxID=294128 RepID=A0A979FKX1_HYAAZ|nr:uncharacterized protein LOC125178041 [Hyalella azteca]
MPKKFSGIFFLDSTWQIVPTDWLCSDKRHKRVWWPSQGNVTDLARNETPIGDQWTLHAYRNIAVASDDFERAEQMILLGEAPSTSSETEACSPRTMQHLRRSSGASQRSAAQPTSPATPRLKARDASATAARSSVKRKSPRSHSVKTTILQEGVKRRLLQDVGRQAESDSDEEEASDGRRLQMVDTAEFVPSW